MDDPNLSQDGISMERLLTMQIIAGALMMGVISFGAVAVFLSLGKEPGDPFMAYMAGGFAALMFVVHIVVPSILVNGATGELKQKQKAMGGELRADEFAVIYQTQMIIALAILEGASFFNLIAYMTSVQWWSLVIVGVLLLAKAVRFPTKFKVDNWIEAQRHELEMESR